MCTCVLLLRYEAVGLVYESNQHIVHVYLWCKMCITCIHFYTGASTTAHVYIHHVDRNST